MQSVWIYVGLFLVVGALVPSSAIILSSIISPKKPNAIKQSTYECGMETVGENWVQFRAQYYIFALVFLFPWAVSLGKLPLFAVMEGVVFVLILIAGLVYAWRKGMLEWA